MKKIFTIFSLILLLTFLTKINPLLAQESFYQSYPQVEPIICGCYQTLESVYTDRGERCVESYEEFKSDPIAHHFWVRDPKITELGKSDERARQFIYWVISHPSIDNHPGLMEIWKLTRNIAYFLTIFIVALFGLGFIVGQRFNFDLGIKIWPSIYKTLIILLYITFSASLVIFVIQISDILMKFFIENLRGDQIFNIFFTGPESTEKSYLEFFGCRDLNFLVQEAANAEIFLLKATNVTYYVMGSMIILRKVVLWFMLFVSPFLALLMPFIFIRNIGWIWIGVFFQWVFYGPLFALFLGALAKIWANGIPFPFDFSRVDKPEGYVFPTAINIFYGGPAQRLSFMNNGNYVDTFAEYVITLIMLWAVTFFPWWLLRIFRDYCCDGIYAMKNILMSMFDQMRGGPSPAPSIQPTPSPTTISTALKIPKEVEIPVKIRLETIEEIKKAKTEEISRSLTMETRKLTDIARFETNKELKETVTRNINYLKNPLQAETPTQRQKFMNLKTELYQRALKQDVIAKNIVSAISTSTIEQKRVKEEVLKTVPQTMPVTSVVSYQTKLSQPKTASTINNLFNQIATNNQITNQIAKATNLSSPQINSFFQSLQKNINQPLSQIVNNISQQTGIEKEKVVNTIKTIKEALETHNQTEKVIEKVAESEKITKEEGKIFVQSLANNFSQIIGQPELAPSVSFTQSMASSLNKKENEVFPIVNNLFNQIATNNQITNQIAKATNLSSPQINSFFQSLQKNINQPLSQIVNNISQQTGIEKEKVVNTIKTIKEALETHNQTEKVIEKVAESEGVEKEKIKELLASPVDILLQPEKNIEKTITIPPTVSIDEYEQVKKMWVDHYERGELPISENITNRQQWVERDVVLITNTLNKLLSDNPELKQEGLDDVSYILPIFLINNLSGEQLVAYLKAKIEAAKEVQKLLEKEEEITQKLKEKAEQEKVPVEAKKKTEKAKELEMGMEMEEEKKEEKNS